MSGIGFSELIILALIGLIVLGPERLPRVASQIGSWLGQARRMTRVMKRQLEEELDLESKPNIKAPPTSSQADKPPFPPKSGPSETDAESEPPPEYVSANEDDDSYSPAHSADDIGTGVGDEEVVVENEEAIAQNEEPPIGDADEADDSKKAGVS